MSILSSIAPIELSRESKSPWLQCLIYFFMCSVCAFAAYSIWTKSIVQKRNVLNKEFIECQKNDSIYNYSLKEYKKLLSLIKTEDNRCLIQSKIIETECLKYQNIVKKEVVDREIEEYLYWNAKYHKIFIVLLFLTIIFAYILFFQLWIVVKVEYYNSKSYSYCQSCGKTLSRVLRNYGTERNGQNSPCFCIDCYQNGKFVFPDISLDEMSRKVQKEMKRKNIPDKKIKRKIKNLSYLERWKCASDY